MAGEPRFNLRPVDQPQRVIQPLVVYTRVHLVAADASVVKAGTITAPRPIRISATVNTRFMKSPIKNLADQ